MKKYIFILSIALVVLAGCSDNFLDKNPLDQPSSQIFWKTGADAYTGLVGVYSNLQLPYMSDMRFPLDCISDDGYARDNSGSSLTISEGQIGPTTGGLVSDLYSQCYVGISACNIYLQNVVSCVMDADLKNRYVGEVKFLRAWFYYNLVMCYGDVVIYETPPTVDNSIVKQSPRADVLSLIYKDLDYAISVLPNDSYTGNAVKNTALALKTKVLMNEAKWSDAATTANLVISSGKAGLSSDYFGLFITRGQASNPNEILFSTKFLAPNNLSNYETRVGWMAIPNPRKELVNEFECTDGLTIQNSPLYNPKDPYSNRDPRLKQTVQVSPWILNGVTIQQEFSATGFYFQKGIDPSKGQISYSSLCDLANVHLRYADILLMRIKG